MNRLTGLIASVATPLDTVGEIDLPPLVEHCERLLRLGCDGLNLLGTTGEATSFSVAQRLTAMETIAAAGLPLDRFMVGTGAAALADAARLTRAAMELGYAGALVLPPYYYKGLDVDSVTGYFRALLAAVGVEESRIYLYNFPQNSGVPFALEIVDRLVGEFPLEILGLKDSSGDLLYAAALAKRLPGFAVFPSAEGSVAHALEFGFAGCISASLNVTAPIMAPAWASRGTSGAEAPIETATAIRVALSQLPLVAAVKWALADLLGEPAWQRLAPPLRALSPAEADQLESALRTTDFEVLRPHFAAPNSGVSIA